jgi:hypothetical protein
MIRRYAKEHFVEMNLVNRRYGLIRIIFHIALMGLFISIMRLPWEIKLGLFIVGVLAFGWLYRPPVVGESMYGEHGEE